MSRIDNAQLTISTDPMQNRAAVSASCDVTVTELERNAIKLLDLTYTVECQVLNRDLQYQATVLKYNAQSVPGDLPVAHMVFSAVVAMSDLHQHLFTDDQLRAEFVLTNGETGAQDIVQSPVVTVELAA
jgi:hypothetical protein